MTSPLPGRGAAAVTAIRSCWRRESLRIRLVAGFAAAMLIVLTGAGTFVYLRVQYALDLRLDEDLAAQSQQIVALARGGALRGGAGDAVVAADDHYQILDASNQVLAHSGGAGNISLLRPNELTAALHRPLRRDRGGLLPISSRTLRLSATPLHPGTIPAAGQPAVVVVAVRRDQRDEALRELIGQLTAANLAALAVASVVGYLLARRALTPVERYRTEAARITAGATGVRLAVPDGAEDEVARLGRTLNDMLAALDTALERERRFVADASHELRTPLTLLSTELELALRRPRTAAELEQTVRAAVADTADLIALVNSLLDVGAPSAHGPMAEVDLGDLVTGIVDRYQAATGTAVDRQIDPGPMVYADPARLTRVVTNLLDNAVRHGGGTTTVTVRASGPMVLLTVADTGPGMDPQFLPHATERFRRAADARASPGSGLGLSLVDATVRAHHGGLRICSRTGHHHTDTHLDIACAHRRAGTTVTVLLPAFAGSGTRR